VPGFHDRAGDLRAVGLTRSREVAKEGRWRAVFEYEYEYRPPGRTEYEYEGGGQWAVGRFGLTRSREAAKGNARGLLWCVVNCLLSSQLSRIYSLWHGCHVPLTPDPSPPFHGGEGRISGQSTCKVFVSREAAKARRKAQRAAVRGAVFEYEYEYRPPGRTEYEYEGGGQWAVGWFGGWAVGSHAKPRSREGGTQWAAVVCGELPALLSTFSHLLSMAWMPWPPHPRPLSPVSRGRGEQGVISELQGGGSHARLRSSEGKRAVQRGSVW
jgi:hypothetical protein